MELAWLLWVWEGAALASHMANLAAAKTPILGHKVGLVCRGEFGRVGNVVGLAVVVARQVVDLGGEVVDGDMEIVDIHSVGINLGGASGKVREENGMDQACLFNSLVQVGRLAKLDLLAGVGFEAFDIPVQGGLGVEGGNTAQQSAKLMGVESYSAFSLLKRLHRLAGSSDGVGGSVERKECFLEGGPGSSNV